MNTSIKNDIFLQPCNRGASFCDIFCHKNQPLEEVQIFIHETFFLVELKQVPPAAAAATATLENLGEARASCDSLSFGAVSQRKKKICSLAKRPTLTKAMRQERFPFG